MAASLIYKQGFITGAGELLNTLDTLLTLPFSSIEPRGIGWNRVFSDGYDGYSGGIYSSLGSSRSERINLKLRVSGDNTYIDVSIAQFVRAVDGYLLNSRGDSTTRITTGLLQIEYRLVANQDFLELVILVGTTYTHHYIGLINRFSPNQNSSIYGLTAPSPLNTTTPLSVPFTIGSNTTLYLRTGFDAYGGYDSHNIGFVQGQQLYIIDQSLGTTTINNQGIVIFNSADLIANTINVSYLMGSNTFSSFAIIGVDPQPVALNTNGTIRGNSFMMLDDYIGDLAPLFTAVDEFSFGAGLPPMNIQGPDIRGIYITMPIRLFNSQEIRGTLFGLIDVPIGNAGVGDYLQTFDNLYRFLVLSDGSTNLIAMGSII